MRKFLVLLMTCCLLSFPVQSYSEDYSSNYNLHKTSKQHDHSANILAGSMIGMVVGGISTLAILDKWHEVKNFMDDELVRMRYPKPPTLNEYIDKMHEDARTVPSEKSPTNIPLPK